MSDALPTVDYLVIGAGAVGMAFVDTLIAEDPDATVLIVDRHDVPGGHWNDAYPFVRLHQPSAFYGVEGLELGRGEIDRSGPNEGYYELAGCAEVLAYYERAMRKFIESGRVTFWPMTDYRGGGRCVGILSGEQRMVEAIKRVVDTTYFDTQVPATHTPRFEIEPGTRFMPTGELPNLVRDPDAVPSHFVVLGGGKTAMDTAGWLLGHDVAPERITWVRPRDSWMINRRFTQPGLEFFEGTIDFQSALMRAAIAADNVEGFFLELGKGGHMLRLDPDVQPTKFFFATISEGEVEALRAIDHVIRGSRVSRIAPGLIEMEDGSHAVPDDSLFIDCTASAVADKDSVPVFQDGKIVVQALFAPLVVFGAALTAWIEVHRDNDDARNALAQPIAVKQGCAAYLTATLGNLTNRMRWAREPNLAEWLGQSRLDPAARTIAKVQAERPELLGALGDYRTLAKQGVPALMQLIQNARED
ncbi:NAD(P)-binding protein [Sphingomicrobium marinum]|uniref:NAD(P)-binding protein n=1 Tax=Sphingomicrobium marinum TaxID=1227950 RepID=UPI00223F54A6|nr:hypothetical protein [Sphingomicrobium marinum]